MQHFELKGKVRKAEGKAAIKAFRRQGLVPCNLYGANVENTLFTVDAKELKGVTNTPYSYIVDIVLDNGKKFAATMHELQFHPISDECLHVDFLAVSDSKPVSISVPIVIEGHAIGVQKGGKFYQTSRKVRISALEANLPDDIKIDITSLGLDKKITAGDIKVDKVTVLTDKDTIICGVRTTRNTAAESASEGEGAEAPAAE